MAGVAAAAAPPKPNNETVSARRARACCSAPRSRSALRSAAAASDGRRCAPQKRLAASEATPVECAWAPVASRIVDHRGQGAMQMKGNVRAHAHALCALLVRGLAAGLTRGRGCGAGEDVQPPRAGLLRRS